MRTYTIEGKMSNTGTCHDLASDNFDRDIKFPKDAIFAVVLAAYYGGKGYTTHKTEGAALTQSNRIKDYSHQIIDDKGNVFLNYYGERLIKE